MEIFSVYVSWVDTTSTTREVRFTCSKSQVIAQITNSLNNDVAPTFAQNCQINVQSLGNVRGPLS